MQTWLAVIAGILVVLGGLLIFSASIGIAYYGLAIQAEIALAIVLLVAASIAGYLFYLGILAQHKQIKTGKEALIGAKGVATSTIDPKGEVRVNYEFWQATAKDAAITSGEEIEVVDMEGMILVVKSTKQKA